MSRQYDDFMNHVNYFQYSLLTSIACLIWCMEKTGLSMHSTSVCYLVKKLSKHCNRLGPINLVRVSCPLCCINVNMSYRIQVFLNIHFCSCSSVSTELLVCFICVCFCGIAVWDWQLLRLIDMCLLYALKCIGTAINYFELNWIELI